jgi:hypothetical protein
MRKNTKREGVISFSVADYQCNTYTYDIVLGLLGEYPTDIDDPDYYTEGFTETVFLKITAAEYWKTSFFADFRFPNEIDTRLIDYEEVLAKYFTPHSRQIILDIAFSFVPIEVAEKESIVGPGDIEARGNDHFIQVVLDEYRIPNTDLYKLFDADQVQIISPGDEVGISCDVFYGFYSYIVSKIVSIQPNVYIPHTYELHELSYASHLLADPGFVAYYAERLNHIGGNLGRGNDAFSQLLIDSFYSIKNKMILDRIFAECSLCGSLFPYLESKKYCSPGCRKRAENRRYYEKHKSRLKTLKRNDVRAAREFYRRKGINK